MKKMKPNLRAFISSHKRMRDNSLMFENISEVDRVGDINTYTISILSEYLPELIANSSTHRFETVNDAEKYYHRPKRLSKDLYGVSDYWWILLAVNSYVNIDEFKDFNWVLVPSDVHVDKIVTILERERKLNKK